MRLDNTVVYFAKPGDYLVKIAQEHGTTWQAIWNHPLNAEHRRKRGSPDVLGVGDMLHTCTTGANVGFTDELSARLQVYLRAHTAHVAYERATPTHAMYDHEPATPRGLHEWPVDYLAAERNPGPLPTPTPSP